MNQQAMAKMPTTIDEVHALPHAYAKTHAQACAIAAEKLPNYDGPITSRKVFMEPATNRLVYVFIANETKQTNFLLFFKFTLMLYLTAVIFVIILYAAIVISCILNANKNNKHLTEQQQADADARIKAYLDFTTHIII